MKHLAALVVIISLTGCANWEKNPASEWIIPSQRVGYTDYDPCIRCGEHWRQLPNPTTWEN